MTEESQKLYEDWIKQRKDKDPMTRTQNEFAKFCFEHFQVLGQIGNLNDIFKECRDFIKSDVRTPIKSTKL